MEEKFVWELSQEFWDNYKLFIKEEFPLSELKKFLSTPDDVVFYHKNCDPNENISASLKMAMKKDLNAFIDEFLDEIEKSDVNQRKCIARKYLLVFLGNYSCITDESVQKKCKDIMSHFSSSVSGMKPNEYLDQTMRNLISVIASPMNADESDNLTLNSLVVFKLICIYGALAISDMEGVAKCKKLGEEISTNWNKTTPESITLSILKKKEKDSKLPINELELLERYSFGAKNGAIAFYGSFFKKNSLALIYIKNRIKTRFIGKI